MTVSCKRDETLDITNTEYISFKFSDDALSAIGTLTKGTCDTLSYEITDWDYTGGESDTDVQTKGTLTESLSGELGLFMLQVPGKTSVTDTLTKNQSLSVSGSSVTASSQILWKDRTVGSNLVSFAYAPYSDTVKVRGAKPYIMYTVPGNVTEQKDILYAVDTTQIPSSSSARKPIDLKFRHALTAVQFKMNFDTLNIKSIKLVGVAKIGKLFAGNVEASGTADYELNLDPAKTYKRDSLLNAKENTFLMLPQAFSSTDTAKVVITFKDNSTLSAPLKDQVWPAGKKIIYTLGRAGDPKPEYVYFDLALGRVRIYTDLNDHSKIFYDGYVYANGGTKSVKGSHTASTRYYIYQSTSANRSSTGYTAADYNTVKDASGNVSKSNSLCRVPTYSDVVVGGKTWGDYITNNTHPEQVLSNWCSSSVHPEATINKILICGDSQFDVTLDNIYSSYFPYMVSSGKSAKKTSEGIKCYTNYTPDGKVYTETFDRYGGINIGVNGDNWEQYTWNVYDPAHDDSEWEPRAAVQRQYHEKVTIRLVGNNYFSRIDYSRPVLCAKDGYLKITSAEGDGIAKGTLTVTLPYKRKYEFEQYGYILSRCSLIGPGNPDGTVDSTTGGGYYNRQVSNLEFNGGTVYVGVEDVKSSVWSDNSQMVTCIGGTNSWSSVTVNGGILTSVSYGPGAAIGGGAGWTNIGGRGDFTMNGGTVYAHSFGVKDTNTEKVLLGTAIGGGSTAANSTDGSKPTGAPSKVNITGGTVYAYSVGGIAIGGGASVKYSGGDAEVQITGGKVFANSIFGTIAGIPVTSGVAIGGGRAGQTEGDGGKATIAISGGTLQSGSVGGGKCDNSTGKIGSADINISGGETSAQFIMAKGAATAPVFTMSDGTIKNSSTSDTSFPKVQSNGGAVYMEEGECTISGGTIDKCSASLGGAVYMNGGTFNMTAGTISNCSASTHGGAVYIDGGDATVSGGAIEKNLASAGNGGGVYVSAGNFTMPDGSKGKINNNSADASSASTDGNGGGIYVRSTTKDVKVEIKGGNVQYNAADRNGGGLCVDMEGSSHKATIKIGENDGPYNNPLISMNSAALSGGGMAVQGSGSNIYIYSGTVKGNVSAYVQNEDIRNDGGMVDLVGKNSPGVVDHVDVNYKTITFYANNGYDPEPYDEQRVITSTNSPLTPTATALAFEKEFYKKVSWNTKRDGSGVTYNLNGTGEVMNITSDLSLYAQWVENK